MPKKTRTDEELRASIMKSAVQLLRSLRSDEPADRAVFVSILASLVVAAKDLWGRRYTERKIKLYQAEHDLAAAGICVECVRNLALDDDEFCQNCADEAAKLEQEATYELIRDSFERVPTQGRKPS